MNIHVWLCLIMYLCMLVFPAREIPLYEKQPPYVTTEEELAFEEAYFQAIVQSGGPGTADFDAQSPHFQALFVVFILDMEVQCGGIAQYFYNNGSLYACRTEDALRQVGLAEMADLYAGFVENEQITMEEIDGYRQQFPTLETIGQLSALHPFDGFDEAYMQLRDSLQLERTVLSYIDAHPEMFR